ncbi:UTP--glucose-1-phosphate uridylyltransferase GalU [Clostridium senegalense]|uniref:UTP--glucose-1-phosphate uridylyltransferase GalU n=1 Tax=Clostridium senegalense TaxID=1465809 RepID=UPI001C116BEB|nr:UTP--glucose-1-phosphate uridylyltransferase GalU [Clostridium senegalense]
MKITKAVIPAAGLGTRFLPVTKAIAKEMLPILDKPTIQYIVEEIVDSGIKDILIITGHNKKAIEDHFDRALELEMNLKKNNKKILLNEINDITNMANIHYIRQKEPKGLGHAILCAKSFIKDEPFAVLLGDDIVYSKEPCIKQLINQFNAKNSTILGVQDVEKDEVYKYGIVDGNIENDRLYKVKSLIEKPSIEVAPSNIAILGRYIITPEIFNILENIKPSKNNEIQLTDALNELSKKESVYAYNFTGKRYDIGDKLGFLKANIEFALRNNDIKDSLKDYLIDLNFNNYNI